MCVFFCFSAKEFFILTENKDSVSGVGSLSSTKLLCLVFLELEKIVVKAYRTYLLVRMSLCYSRRYGLL